jgi:hypothetical protein
MRKLLFACLIVGGALGAFAIPGTARTAISTQETVAQTETCMKLCLNTKASRQACRQRCLNRPG